MRGSLPGNRIRRLLPLALLLIGGVARALEGPAAPSHYTAEDTVVVLGAVPQEIPPYVQAMGDPPQQQLWGIPYWEGRIAGRHVVVAITGIGKTLTAMTSTLFIERFRPRLVLMSGTGARINAQLRTGDVIVAEHVHEHDYGSLTREGMVYRPFNGPDNGNEMANDFSPHASLLAKADSAMATYRGPEVNANGSTYNVKVRRGVVASSDLFGVTQQRIDELRKNFRTDIMEMESGPLGHVCQQLGVPCIVVRAGSNVAQEAPNDDYLRLGPIAAKQAALFGIHLLGYL